MQIIWKRASWGGFESLMTMSDLKTARNLSSSYLPTGEYLRIYVGTEDISDLIQDIENSFLKMRKKFKL